MLVSRIFFCTYLVNFDFTENSLLSLQVISLEVWNKAMSHWMQAINQEVPKDELVELQTVFCKIFDPDMSPLGFDAKEMYQFISERFNQNSIEVLRQALQWLQLLCLLNIPIPIGKNNASISFG